MLQKLLCPEAEGLGHKISKVLAMQLISCMFVHVLEKQYRLVSCLPVMTVTGELQHLCQSCRLW